MKTENYHGMWVGDEVVVWGWLGVRGRERGFGRARVLVMVELLHNHRMEEPITTLSNVDHTDKGQVKYVE